MDYLAPQIRILNLSLSTSSVMMTHFVNKDERIQYIHGTTIGLFLSCFITQKKSITNQPSSSRNIGVRAGGARGAAAPPNFGQLRFFGQHEKIWAKPEEINIFYFNLKSA